MEGLEYFAEIASTLNNAEIDEWKAGGGRVVGTVCSNIPEEVLHAAGIMPIRLRAPKLEDTSAADACLHPINCSYTRSVLELVLRDEVDFLDGLVTTNTCDHMLRLAGELKDKAAMPMVHYFSMFHTLGEPAKRWFATEIQRLIDAIGEAYGIKVSDDDLRRSIAVYNETRDLMVALDGLRKDDPPAVSGAEYMQIVLAGMSMPKEKFNDKLRALLPELEGRKAGEAGLPRLMIVGGACDLPEFIDFIEEKGAAIVADGLCFGARQYAGAVDESAEDPLRAISERYASRAACPSIINAFDQSFDQLKKVAAEYRIDGIVCARLKFCDHWGGQRKMLTDVLRTEDLPLLDLEREYNTAGSGQISTRVQAFLEMIAP
jgi:benzoyl-CoA reductase/2-hydroxyglutaryl-CoA dehydratase subunit BcrC/BadD/HgdB